MQETTLSIELTQNIALLLALCLGQWVIAGLFRKKYWTAQVLSGLLFGHAAIMGMITAVSLQPGIIFDARTVILSVGTLFGGPLAGAIAGTIAGAYRMGLGGDGAYVGLASIVSSVLVGLVFRHFYRQTITRIGVLPLFALGIIVHGAALLWFLFLPAEFVQDGLPSLVAPFMITLTLATVVTGFMLREIEKVRRMDTIVNEGERRFQTLFETAAVSIWEEDFSEGFRILMQLKKDGVTDLRSHLADHPKLTMTLMASTKVLRVNQASVYMFGAKSDADLLAGIATTFGPTAQETFIDVLCAIWSEVSDFIGETTFRTFDGRTIDCLISLRIPRTQDQAKTVPVSIVDITQQKEIERALADGRRRLEEVIWGTDVGTWEWNVQTGATIFNERWAEIVGYSLDELAPVSIETWEKLAHPDDLIVSGVLLERTFNKESEYYECEVRMRHKDGHWVWVFDRGKVVEWGADGKPLRMSGIHADITEHKEAEIKAARLAEVRETILECHAAILRESESGKLFDRLCEILVKLRGYDVVWVGILEHDTAKTVAPVAKAGKGSDYLDVVKIHWSDDEYSFGPTGMAAKTGKVQILSDFSESETFSKELADAAAAVGLKTSVALPIFDRGEVLGVLTAYSTTADHFDQTEIDLLSELTGNLGFAVQVLRVEAEKKGIQLSLDRAALGAVNAIAATIEKRDPYTSGHQGRVALLSVAMAEKLGWNSYRIEGLRLGATIHDIGKIYVPAEILNRPGKLSEAEFEMIKSHPQVGYDILANTEFPWPIQDMILQHHERIDGTGYPNGLTGNQIIDEAKIIAIADVVEAITSHRPYRPARGIEAATAEIERGRGSAYDPAIADVCLTLIRTNEFAFST